MPLANSSDTNQASLPKGGLRALIKELGSPDEFGNPASPITGELKVIGKQRNGSVFFKNGKVYSAELDNFTPPIALRLLSTGLITSVMFAALETLKSSEVGKYAILHNFVEEDIIEDIHRQMLFSTLTHMYEWRDAEWLWIRGNKSDSYTISPLESRLTVSATDERLAQWFALVQNHNAVTYGKSIVHPGEDWESKAGEETTPEISSILQYVDSQNTVAEIAAACGFARFEIASRLAKAIADGLIIVENPNSAEPDYGSFESLLHDKEQELAEAEELVIRISESLNEAEVRLALARKNLGI
jgi:hypothetical protein